MKYLLILTYYSDVWDVSYSCLPEIIHLDYRLWANRHLAALAVNSGLLLSCLSSLWALVQTDLHKTPIFFIQSEKESSHPKLYYKHTFKAKYYCYINFFVSNTTTKTEQQHNSVQKIANNKINQNFHANLGVKISKIQCASQKMVLYKYFL